MKKRIAIITGASGGIGKEFTKLLVNEDIDEVWAIARNETKLLNLKKELGDKIITLAKDLTNLTEVKSIGNMLKDQQPVITYLINNAGIAKMGSYKDFTLEEISATVSTNCTLVAALSTICIPYMTKGSKILNISSAASFQPLAYLNLYSATKAFERHYSRALNLELKNSGITVTAVCPSWVDTELLMKEYNGKKIKFPGIVSPEKVALTALHDAKKGKDMSICTFYVKIQNVLIKLFPHKITMNTWLKGIKKYIS